MSDFIHPRTALLGAQVGAWQLPVCDHYSGVEGLMRKSLKLQADMCQEFGTCLFDVTLDCEDGAPVGGEAEHAHLVVSLALQAGKNARVAARVHPVEHAAFEQDIDIIVRQAGSKLSHLMLPKIEKLADIERACRALDAVGASQLPLHALIESPTAVRNAFAIAAHPRVQSLSFGLMDFVSSHAGAIPQSAMNSQGQFSHPLVLRAKLEIAAACHANAKVPSHCVVTEFSDLPAIAFAARRASQELGYMRMWSIHPNQIRPILEAFAPDQDEINDAAEIIASAVQLNWAPSAFRGKLHDRASYRYFWQVLERAHQTGRELPASALAYFVNPV